MELYLSVAACDSSEASKRSADYVCTGIHDEQTIQKAIDRSAAERKNVFLFDGIYHIDGFSDFGDGGPRTALCFPKVNRKQEFRGENWLFGFRAGKDTGVTLFVGEHAFDEVGKDESVDVIRSAWSKKGITNGHTLSLREIGIIVWDSSHPMRCVDFRRSDFAEADKVRMTAFGMRAMHPELKFDSFPIPGKGCIGMTLTDGSNHPSNNFNGVHALGFDEGIQVGGEHPVLINCYASYCRYGYTFGHYPQFNGLNHPITMINCADERNINLPLFDRCGDNGGDLNGLQTVTMIDFNIERLHTNQTPGGVPGDFMRETVPGSWRGTIEFSLQPAWNHINEVDTQIWENDGSGCGIVTRNTSHKAVCSTAERLSYYPTLGEQIYDTDLQKMLICTDPARKEWRDFLGQLP